jgi:hypothetical protein
LKTDSIRLPRFIPLKSTPHRPSGGGGIRRE